MGRLKKLDTSEHNKQLVENLALHCRKEGLARSTTTNYVNQLTRLIKYLAEAGDTGSLDELQQNDFDKLVQYLEDVKQLSRGEIRNYKKVVKKLYRYCYDDDVPRWVAKLRLESTESPVQPSDLLTQEELDRLLNAATHPRNKAFIAVLLDSGVRVGALLSTRIKHVQFNQYGGLIYISKTSEARKTTPARGIPITWSTGYLNQWLAVHPMREDPEAPLWVTLNEPYQPLSYKTMRLTIQKIANKAGIKKRVNLHKFRHQAITTWILDGLSEQEIKHRAGWSKGSTQMMKIYANFTDSEINERIFEHYGLKVDKRQVALVRCPRCNNTLRPSDRVCPQCSLVLDRGAAEELKGLEERVPELIGLLLRSEAVRGLVGK
jgi:integrase